MLSAGVSLGDTVRFDITDLDLSIFGVQYTVDYLGPGDGFVTGVSAHLVYQSGTFAAENIRLQFEAPVGARVPAYPLGDHTRPAHGSTGTGTITPAPTPTARARPIVARFPLSL